MERVSSGLEPPDDLVGDLATLWEAALPVRPGPVRDKNEPERPGDPSWDAALPVRPTPIVVRAEGVRAGDPAARLRRDTETSVTPMFALRFCCEAKVPDMKGALGLVARELTLSVRSISREELGMR